MRSYVPLVARLLLGLIFVMSGITKITGFAGTQQYMASHGIPATAVLLVGAIVVEVLGGLSIILGLWARVGATALVLFLIPATLIFHTDFGQQTQMIMFLKNLSIMGGLLLVMAFGTGEYYVRAMDVGTSDVASA
ncbi:DoxX family protein [Salinibacter sp. 10B]|uniref:DoxX family protein n=1 Tax=Salinibacter sp. 10B TaxID=1923971 RepID=UPI000CF3D680|nr:DoxX family protein [Salinibacter sp. 10B]PQJ35815.1 DoxX family protein [Salinibacter sp. 10B]